MKAEEVLGLYHLYADGLYKFAYSYIGNGMDAEDIVQDIFLKLIQKNIHVAKGKEKSYLMSMTANACKDLLKSGNVRMKIPFDDIWGSVLEDTMSKENSDVLLALKDLPENYRVVIHLHYYEGYTINEIAKILKLSKSAVSMRLTRGRSELKALLKSY